MLDIFKVIIIIVCFVAASTMDYENEVKAAKVRVGPSIYHKKAA